MMNIILNMDSRLKASTVRKNKNIKAEATEDKDGYNAHSDITTRMYNDEAMDNKTLSCLIAEINQLAPADHMIIYALLRAGDGVSKEFFSHSKKAVHFDIGKLPNELKWKLSMHIKMTKENNERQKLINLADKDHREHIDALDSKLDTKHPAKIVISDDDTGITETDRYEKMLQLNNKLT